MVKQEPLYTVSGNVRWLQPFRTVPEAPQFSSVQFSCSVMSDSLRPHELHHTRPQASLSITNSRSSPKLMFIESMMPSSHLNFCRPLLLLPQSLPASETFPMS